MLNDGGIGLWRDTYCHWWLGYAWQSQPLPKAIVTASHLVLELCMSKVLTRHSPGSMKPVTTMPGSTSSMPTWNGMNVPPADMSAQSHSGTTTAHGASVQPTSPASQEVATITATYVSEPVQAANEHWLSMTYERTGQHSECKSYTFCTFCTFLTRILLQKMSLT